MFAILFLKQSQFFYQYVFLTICLHTLVVLYSIISYRKSTEIYFMVFFQFSRSLHLTVGTFSLAYQSHKAMDICGVCSL